MKALVIGASGHVGGALLQALERSGIEATGTYYSRPLGGSLKLDVLDASEVRSCLTAARPDVVFLAVEMAGSPDDGEAPAEQTRHFHLSAAKNVAIAASDLGARLVYFSTEQVFDGMAGPYSEDDAPHPTSANGRIKLEAEQYIKALAPQYLIIRTATVFGWHRASRNIAMEVWECLQSGRSLRLPDDEWTTPTLVDYLAEASVRLAQLDARGIFNVAGRDFVSLSELGKALARAVALDPGLIQPSIAREPGHDTAPPLKRGLETEKLKRALGTDPLDLSESLKRLRRHWRADTHIALAPANTSTEADKLKQEIFTKVRQYYDLVHKPTAFTPYKTRVQYSGRVFGHQEMVNLVDSALDFWLTMGPYGDLFEQKMKRIFNARDFVLVNSGSSANLTAILALMSQQVEDPLRPGDEVITPAVTFPTTLAPIVHGGMVPVFVDCEIGTYNINATAIEGAISERTRALMIPHTLGNPCDMDVICDIAKRHNLFLVEDSCDALGSTFRGKLVGTFGDLATLSFYPAHHITLGEGGGVIVNDPRLSRITRSVRDWGRDCWCAPGESNTCGKRFGWELGDLPRGYDHKYIYTNIGYNFKPTDLQAAVGVAQANRMPEFVEKRRRNFKVLYEGLEPFQDRLILPTLDPRSDPSWFGLPITVKNGTSRHELVQWLENANIETREVFAGSILKQPGYQNINRRVHGTLENSDRVMRDTFFIGVYPGLTDEMLEFVVDAFRRFFARKGHN